MKKTYYLFLVTLYCNVLSFGQTVNTSLTVVNNTNVNSTGPINLGTNEISNISLVSYISLPSSISDNTPGTINVYYQKNTSNPALIPQGGNGGNLLFAGGTFTSRSFNIILNPTQFDLTGGFLYTEYTAYSGIKYKSANIPIVKTTTIPPNIPPSDPINASQIVPYGGIPLLPNFADYFNMSSQNWVNNTNTPVLSDQNGWILYNSVTLRQQTIFNDGRVTYEPQKMNIIVSKFLPNLSRLYVNNQINNNIYVIQDQMPNTIIGNQASESHNTTTRTAYNLLNNYQWQSRIIYPFWWESFNYGLALYGWNDIPGANQINYTPSSLSRGMEYSRLILENPLDTSIYRNCSASNIVTAYPISNTDIENNICCDQTIYLSTIVNPIVGSNLSGPIFYIWETSPDGINWFKISNANGKDFTPIKPGGSRRFGGVIKYRG